MLNTRNQQLDTLTFSIQYDKDKVEVIGITHFNIPNDKISYITNPNSDIIYVSITQQNLNIINGPLLRIEYKPLQPCSVTWRLQSSRAVRYDFIDIPTLLNSTTFNIKKEVASLVSLQFCRSDILNKIKSQWGNLAEFEIYKGSSQSILDGFLVKRIFMSGQTLYFDKDGNSLTSELVQSDLLLSLIHI